jgi:hypothetical protein
MVAFKKIHALKFGVDIILQHINLKTFSDGLHSLKFKLVKEIFTTH